MKQYILVCVNEDKEVVSTEAFSTLVEAQKQMMKEYFGQLNENENVDEDGDCDYIDICSLGEHSAHIYYGTDLEYHWEISSIDVPVQSFVLGVNKYEFDKLVWQNRTNFGKEQYDEWLNHTAVQSLQNIYDCIDCGGVVDTSDQYILGDIINLLSRIKTNVKP